MESSTLHTPGGFRRWASSILMIQHGKVESSTGRSWSGALRIVARRHFSPFKIYVRRDLQLAVFLNPKVGSTTFRRVLVEGLQEANVSPTLSRAWPIRLSRRYLSAPPADYLDLISRPHNYKFHCFVRNPYARLLSAWKDKFSLTPEGKPAARSMKRELPAVRRFAQRNGLPGDAPGSAVPFETFLAYVESQRQGQRNQHWDTQVSVLACDAIQYEQTYQMESQFNEGMTHILTQVGLSPEWLAERLATPRNPSRKLNTTVYNADLAERVYNIYRADFEQFGYARDGWQGL